MEQLPGIKGIEHIGLTVPGLEEAVEFFVQVLGCEPVYDIGPFKSTGNWMETQLDVDPRAEIPKITMLKCHGGPNLELFEYKATVQSHSIPKNSDIGGHHLSFYVEDIQKGVETLKKNGLRVLGEPVHMTGGASARESWIYFLSPWDYNLNWFPFPMARLMRNTPQPGCLNPAKVRSAF